MSVKNFQNSFFASNGLSKLTNFKNIVELLFKDDVRLNELNLGENSSENEPITINLLNKVQQRFNTIFIFINRTSNNSRIIFKNKYDMIEWFQKNNPNYQYINNIIKNQNKNNFTILGNNYIIKWNFRNNIEEFDLSDIINYDLSKLKNNEEEIWETFQTFTIINKTTNQKIKVYNRIGNQFDNNYIYNYNTQYLPDIIYESVRELGKKANQSINSGYIAQGDHRDTYKVSIKGNSEKYDWFINSENYNSTIFEKMAKIDKQLIKNEKLIKSCWTYYKHRKEKCNVLNWDIEAEIKDNLNFKQNCFTDLIIKNRDLSVVPIGLQRFFETDYFRWKNVEKIVKEPFEGKEFYNYLYNNINKFEFKSGGNTYQLHNINNIANLVDKFFYNHNGNYYEYINTRNANHNINDNELYIKVGIHPNDEYYSFNNLLKEEEFEHTIYLRNLLKILPNGEVDMIDNFDKINKVYILYTDDENMQVCFDSAGAKKNELFNNNLSMWVYSILKSRLDKSYQAYNQNNQNIISYSNNLSFNNNIQNYIQNSFCPMIEQTIFNPKDKSELLEKLRLNDELTINIEKIEKLKYNLSKSEGINENYLLQNYKWTIELVKFCLLELLNENLPNILSFNFTNENYDWFIKFVEKFDKFRQNCETFGRYSISYQDFLNIINKINDSEQNIYCIQQSILQILKNKYNIFIYNNEFSFDFNPNSKFYLKKLLNDFSDRVRKINNSKTNLESLFEEIQMIIKGSSSMSIDVSSLLSNYILNQDTNNNLLLKKI